jgi:hypothetical protein
MRQYIQSGPKVLFMSVLVLLVILALFGTAAADGDDLMPCRQSGTCNATAGYYGQGMMGGYGYRYGYGMMNASSVQAMESLEISAMGRPMHDEMQALLGKGVASNLTPAEQARLVEIMNQYPGHSTMMMNRMTGGYGQYSAAGAYGPGAGGYPGMMGGYGPYAGTTAGTGMMGGVFPFMFICILLFGLFYIVWLVAGILLVVWLLKQLKKNTAVS